MSTPSQPRAHQSTSNNADAHTASTTSFASDGQMLTPDSVVIQLPVARIGSRTIARLIDEIILNVAIILFMILLAYFGSSLSLSGDTVFVILTFFFLFMRIGIMMAINYLMNGKTPGKALYGMQIVAKDGSPASLVQYFLRELIGTVEFILGGLIAILTSFFSPLGQRLGDLAANTLVIHSRGQALDAGASFIWQVPPFLEDYTASLDVGRLDAKMYVAIRRYLIRCTTFLPKARGELALTMAVSMSQRTGIPLPPDLHPELFLLALAAKSQRQDGAVIPATGSQKSAAVASQWSGVAGSEPTSAFDAQPEPQPTQPGFGQPAQPGFGQPAQPGYGQPTQPGYGQPAQPGFGQPAQPAGATGFEQPQPAGATGFEQPQPAAQPPSEQEFKDPFS